MPLKQIEHELLLCLPALNLRPTLDAAIEAGKLLVHAKELVEHGHWMNWLKRVGLTQRTAHDYQTCYLHAGDQRPAANMTIKQFLVCVRDARRRDRLAERARVRAEIAARRGTLAEDIILANRDCRKYDWPGRVDAVVTDPPWADLESYRWLGEFCRRHLRPGGLLICQVGTRQMPSVMGVLSNDGLIYQWVLAVVYHQTRFCRPFGVWSPGWRPVLAYSNGEPDKTPLTSDTYTVPGIRGRADLHDWQQPHEPISHWVGRLTRPADLVADPFVGSGTVAVACREHGRRFVGTEIDRRAYRVARGRLADLERVQVQPARDRGADNSPPVPADRTRQSS